MPADTMFPQNGFSVGDGLAMGVARVGRLGGALFDRNGALLHALQGPVVSTTGQTLAVTDSAKDTTVYIKPAGTLAALTVNLPPEASSRIGQRVTIITSQTLTSLTLAQAGGGGTFLGAVTTLAAGASVTYEKVEANTWARVA